MVVIFPELSSIAYPIIGFVFGAVIGSFLNVIILRLPNQKTLDGRSHCPQCGVVLKPINLIPIVSYVVQRGQCANCTKKISFRYPLIESITGILFALALYVVSPLTLVEGIVLVRLLFFLAVLVVVFVIDFEHYLILDVVVLPAAVIMFVLNGILDVVGHVSLVSWGSATVSGLVAAAVFGLFFYGLWAVSKGRWMGFGDVKLSVLLGLSLGITGAIVGFILSFWLGALVGIGLMLAHRKTMNSRLPFGTFLAVGCAFAALYGPSLWGAYARLVGLQ